MPVAFTTSTVSPLFWCRGPAHHRHIGHVARAPPRCAQIPPSAAARGDAAATAATLRALVSSSASRNTRDEEVAPLIDALERVSTSADTTTTHDPNLLGVWRNSYTTRSATASVIQRTVVRYQSLAPHIEQVVLDDPAAPGSPAHIVTRVDLRPFLGAILNLRARVTDTTPRRLYVRFEQSWFMFDRLPVWLGARRLPVPFALPYPVPFRLLGAKACGWLDTTFLQRDLRIARGNRGSTFVLTRVDPIDELPRLDDLRAAIAELT